MGYDIHITRQENWLADSETLRIPIHEWKEYVMKDPEMRLDNFAAATTTNGETIHVESEGLSVWTKYSGDGENGNHAWFYYWNGTIVVKNPDDEIINKMVDIAIQLGAKVQGDEGEIYERSSDNKISYRHSDNNNNNLKSETKKHWWKFW